MASMNRVLLATIVVALTQGLAQGQLRSAHRQPSSAASNVVAQPSAEDQSTGIQPRQADQMPSSSCSLRAHDMIPQVSADSAIANAPSICAPLSARCKFNLFLGQTRSPYTFVSAGFEATLAQATAQWPHYGGGAQGWAKRLGATLADTESRRFIQTFALSTMLHQDPRYFPSLKRLLIARMWYAATRVMTTKNDNGDSTFNTSEFLGALLTSSLQNSYYPRHDRTFGDTMNRFDSALSSDAIGDLVREFTPDMKRLFRKHAPNKILEIEEKLPIPAEDRP
jgi:hypothetical protein